MPGVRSFSTVVMIEDRHRQRRHFGKGDQLRPDVVERLLGEYSASASGRIGKPADVGTGVQQKRGVRETPRRTGTSSS